MSKQEKNIKLAKTRGNEPLFRSVYCAIYPIIHKSARDLGYALTVHGSLERDFDIVAIPWSQDCANWRDLVRGIMESTDFIRSDFFDDDIFNPPHCEEKPHNRVAISIPIRAGMYFDLSVIKPIREKLIQN